MANPDRPTEAFDTRGPDRDFAISAAAAALQRGELVVVPTDTVYGVAADAFQPSATRRVFVAKRRARSVPLPVLVRSPKQLLGLTPRVPEEADRLMAAYWPGPVTIVVAADDNLRWDLGLNQGTVAVRMPFDDVTLDLIRAVGPIACTSANLHGHPPATTVPEAQGQLGAEVRVYLDDGPRRTTQASAVVDLTRGEPHVLRSGAIPDEELLAVARGELDPLDATQLPPPPSATDDHVADDLDALAPADAADAADAADTADTADVADAADAATAADAAEAAATADDAREGRPERS